MAIPWSAVEFLVEFLSEVSLSLLGFRISIFTLTSLEAAALSRIEGSDDSVVSFSYAAGEVAGADGGVAGAAEAVGLETGA